jgi:hypothetical protein
VFVKIAFVLGPFLPLFTVSFPFANLEHRVIWIDQAFSQLTELIFDRGWATLATSLFLVLIFESCDSLPSVLCCYLFTCDCVGWPRQPLCFYCYFIRDGYTRATVTMAGLPSDDELLCADELAMVQECARAAEGEDIPQFSPNHTATEYSEATLPTLLSLIANMQL